MENKKQIVQLHKNGNSISSIARKFKISRQMVHYIVYPDKYAKAKKAAVAHTKSPKDNVALKQKKLLKLEQQAKDINIKIIGIKNYLKI